LADFEEVKTVQQKGGKEGARPKTSGMATSGGLVKKRTFEYNGGGVATSYDNNFKIAKNSHHWIADDEYSIFNHPLAFGTTDSDLKQSPPRSLKKSKIGE
jgi:hypothetical protein